MTRRLQTCVTCKPGDEGTGRFSLKRGLTRHKDRRCASCRQDIPTAAESARTLAKFRARHG